MSMSCFVHSPFFVNMASVSIWALGLQYPSNIAFACVSSGPLFQFFALYTPCSVNPTYSPTVLLNRISSTLLKE